MFVVHREIDVSRLRLQPEEVGDVRISGLSISSRTPRITRSWSETEAQALGDDRAT